MKAWPLTRNRIWKFGARRAVSPVIATWCFALSLAACAIGPQFIWWKPRFSDEEFARDAYVCRNQARSATSALPIPTYADVIRKTEWEKTLYLGCLEMKGYRRVEGEDGKPRHQFIPSDEGIEVRDRQSPRLTGVAA